MRRARAMTILLRHGWWIWRAGQLRFRLETFGLWWPALPYQAPWWRVPPRNLVLFARRLVSYCRWVVEMEALRRHGPAGWWRGAQRRHRG